MIKKDENCIFCKIINKELPANILYITNRIITILDIAPTSKGHSLIISKQHYSNIHELDVDAFTESKKHIDQTITLLNKTFQPKGFNILNNMGHAAKQVVFHFHLHVIPKYTPDTGLITNSKIQKNIDNEKVYQQLLKNK